MKWSLNGTEIRRVETVDASWLSLLTVSVAT